MDRDLSSYQNPLNDISGNMQGNITILNQNNSHDDSWTATPSGFKNIN